MITDELTQREVQVVDQILRGYSNQRVADELVLSVRTVDTHITHIYRKLGVHTRDELIDAMRTRRKSEITNVQEHGGPSNFVVRVLNLIADERFLYDVLEEHIFTIKGTCACGHQLSTLGTRIHDRQEANKHFAAALATALRGETDGQHTED